MEKYRPKNLEDLISHKDIISTSEFMNHVNHALHMYSGTGTSFNQDTIHGPNLLLTVPDT